MLLLREVETAVEQFSASMARPEVILSELGQLPEIHSTGITPTQF
jgi:hypothetical protein